MVEIRNEKELIVGFHGISLAAFGSGCMSRYWGHLCFFGYFVETKEKKNFDPRIYRQDSEKRE